MLARAKSRPLYQKAIAVTVALAAEAAFLATFLWQPTPHIVRFREGGGVVVQVFGMGRETGASPKPASLTESLMDDIRSRMAPIYVALPLDKGRAPPRSLSDFFQDGAGQSGKAAPNSATSNIDRLAQEAAGRLGDPGLQAATPRQPQFDKNGQALPCWSQSTRPLPVKIIVVLDSRGVMVGKPVIDHPAGVAGNRAAEQEAMSALAGCSPYRPATMAGSYLVVELDFSKARDWAMQVGTTEIR